MFSNNLDQNLPLYGHVLIIENDPIQQQVIHLLVRKIGLSASIIFADEKSLGQLDNRPFDAILIDSVVQFVDSIKLIKMIREDNFTNPIIVLTADSSTQESYLEAGSDGFCRKPLDQQQLYNTLKPYLACNSSSVRDNPIISNLSEKPENKAKVSAFIQTLPSQLNQLRKLYKNAQWEQLVRQTRQLKGKEFGFPALESYTAILEQQIQNADIESAQHTLSDLQIICQRIYLGVHTH